MKVLKIWSHTENCVFPSVLSGALSHFEAGFLFPALIFHILLNLNSLDCSFSSLGYFVLKRNFSSTPLIFYFALLPISMTL